VNIFKTYSIFIDKDYRGKGVTFIALEGALNEIAGSEEAWLKATRKTWKAGRLPGRFFTTGPYLFLSGRDFNASASLARIIGS
jgi:hypothetical protein